MRITASVDPSRVQRLLKAVPSRLEVELYNALRDIGEAHIAEMGTRMERGRIGPAIGGGLVRTSTGRLRRGMQREIRRQGGVGGLRLRLFVANVPYAEIQERGGTINAKTGRYLAIPLQSIRRANGTVQGKYAGGPRSLMGKVFDGESGQSLTFVWKSRDGRLFIVERTETGLKFLWKLQQSVTLKGGLGWYDTWRHNAPARVARIQQAGRLALEKASGA